LIIRFAVVLGSMGVSPGKTIASGVLVQQGRLDLRDAVAFGIFEAAVADQIG
jgi:hypothetical protein